jgi:hypothetical protein
MTLYTIARLAKLTSVSPPSIRLYERLGLITWVAKTPAGYRLYSDDAVCRISPAARSTVKAAAWGTRRRSGGNSGVPWSS